MSSSTQGLTSDKNPMWSVMFWNRVHRYRCLVAKYWWLLLLTLSAAIFTAAWIQMNRPLRYQSVAEMYLDQDRSLNFGGTVNTSTGQMAIDDYMDTERSNILGHAVTQMAADKMQALHPEMPHVDNRVEVLARGPKLTLTGTGPNPAYVQSYLQSVLDAYLDFRAKQRNNGNREATGQVSDQIPIMQETVNEDDKAIIKFQQDHHTVFSTEAGKGANAELAALHTKLGTLNDEYNTLSLMAPDEGMDRNLASNAAGNAASPQAQAGMYTSPAEGDYRAAQDTLVRLQTTMDDLGRDLRPKHPKMVLLKTQIDAQNKIIASLLERNRKRIQNQREYVASEIQATKDQIRDAEPKAQSNALLQMEFDKLQEKKVRDLKTVNDAQTTINSAVLNGRAALEPMHVTDPPSPAVAVPSSWAKMMALALLVGLGAGIGILLVIDRMDDRMNSIADFQGHFAEHVIGQIPRDTSTDHAALLRPDDQRHQLVESFRNLRSTLLYMPLEGTRPKTILITSAIPNEGKSTLSSNLALVMAFAGMKTLLIDADLRRGEIHNAFGVTRDPGFTDVLGHNVNWKIAIRTTGIENLHILPRGRNVPQPSEYLLNKATDKLLQELYPLYDYIIIDSSPVLAADDTASLAPKIDATLFVVRLSFTPAKMTRKSLEILHKRQANIPGLVLNQVDTKSPEFVYYQYSEYYHAATPEEKETRRIENAKPPIEVG